MTEKIEIDLVDLKDISGLSLRLDSKNNRLVFGKDIGKVSPTVKYAKDLESVLMEGLQDDNREVYYAYRGICLRKDEALLQNYQLRYDIIVMPPGTLVREYVKTKGHEHEKIPGTEHTYPEVYLVLYGKINYLLQHRKRDDELGIIDEVLVIEAAAGDKVLIPPDYAHFSVNANNETAVIANLVGTNFVSLYENIEKLQGAAYYLIKDNKKNSFVRNRRYRKVPDIHYLKLEDYPDFGILKDAPAYSMMVKEPETFKYLTQPIGCLDKLVGIYK